MFDEIKVVAQTLWDHSLVGKVFVVLFALLGMVLAIMATMFMAGMAHAQDITCKTSSVPVPMLTAGQFIMDERCPGDPGCESHKLVAVCEGGCHPDKAATVPPPVEPPPVVRVERDVPVRWEAPRGGTAVQNYMVNYSMEGTTVWLQVWAGSQARTATIPKMEVGKKYRVQLFANGTDNVMSPPVEIVTTIKGL